MATSVLYASSGYDDGPRGLHEQGGRVLDPLLRRSGDIMGAVVFGCLKVIEFRLSL
ncbi:MAG: hypothetical protein AAGI06_00480 [Pseudomonadota bacterium]